MKKTRVYSLNTYPTSLFVMNTLPDQFHVHLYFRVFSIADCNYHVRFQKGWSQEEIAEITAKTVTLACIRYQYDSVDCFSFSIMSLNALATLLEAFFKIFFLADGHTDTKALLYPCCTCMCGVMMELISLVLRPSRPSVCRLQY